MSIIKVCKIIVIDAWIRIKIPETHNKFFGQLLNINNDSSKEGENDEEIMKSSISE